MTAKKQPREHVSTKLSLAPMTVDEALSAMLKTPPPPAEKNKTKKRKEKR